MCGCGCNTCKTKIRGPLLTEGRVKKLVSENLQYHIDNNISLMEIEKAISMTGYQANDIKANPVKYSTLMNCCKLPKDRG